MRLVSFDFETRLITDTVQAPEPVCLSWCDGVDAGLLAGPDMWLWLADQLEREDTELVGANVAFDLSVAWVWAPDIGWLRHRIETGILRQLQAGRIRDVQITARLAALAVGWLSYDPTTGKPPKFSLAALAERHLGIRLDKGGDTYRLRYAELIGLPVEQYPPEAVRYAIEDARQTRAVAVWQDRNLASCADEPRQVRAAFALRMISVAGLAVDVEATRALERTLAGEVAQVDAALAAAGIVRPNGTRDMAMLRERVGAAYAARGQAAPRTEGGQVATSGEALLASGDPLLVSTGEIAAKQKLLQGFIPALLAGQVCPSYDVLKESGRTSSWGPNIQQMPRNGGIRELFRPFPGCAYLDADYATLELCALAQVCVDWFGWSRMGDAINAGVDLHLTLAAQLAGASYEGAVASLAQGDATIAGLRQIAKAANFGFPGGMGPMSFVEFARGYGLDLTTDYVERLRDDWMRTFPEMRLYFDRISRSMGTADTMTVQQLRSDRVRGGARYTAACNSYFQGLAADGAKQAVWDVVRRTLVDLPGDPLSGCVVHAFVHDELLLSAPLDRVHEAGQALEDQMVASMREWLPDIAVRVDVVATDRWSKRAKRTLDANGRLVVAACA